MAIISKACEKLRSQNKVCKEGIVFISANPFSNQRQYSQSYRVSIAEPGSDTRPWLSQLSAVLDSIYREDHRYKKAGFILVELSDPNNIQNDLLSAPQS